MALMNLLDERGISNQKLAKASGLAASTITKAVRGDAVSVESAEKIAAALECEARDFFTRKEDGHVFLLNLLFFKKC